MANISRFRVVSALDASALKRFNASIKTTSCPKIKIRAACVDRKVSGLDRRKLSVLWKTSNGKEKFSPSSSKRKGLRMKKNGSRLEKIT